jgi:2-methylcitrate dehydratase PrpD
VTDSHVEKFAAFAAATRGKALPSEVAEDTKRTLLDSIGCGLAAVDIASGRMGVEYARILAGSSTDATILGVAEKSSVHGAAFANAELINALDMDTVGAPGHVSPYVVPAVLAMGEILRRSGNDVMAATAVSHEMSFRFARAMDQNRDIKDGKAHTSPVLGYSSVVFGVAAATGMLKGLNRDQLEHTIGIAGSTTPVNAHRAWLEHVPTTTIKYNLLSGGLTFTGMTAAYLAQLGHRGDKQILDDVEFGYPRFIGTTRWEPSRLTTELGTDWRYPAANFFKPYPFCRVTHALFDGLIELVRVNDIKPDEIESLTAYGEEWVGKFATFFNRDIERPYDAQFSFPHGLALAAHLVPPGKDWQDPENVYNPSVMNLMSKVVWKSHPDWAAAVAANPNARPARVEIAARGTTFVAERSYPKGSVSPDPSTFMTTDEVVEKFLHNARDVIAAEDAQWVADRVMHLEDVDDISTVMTRLRPAAVTATV